MSFRVPGGRRRGVIQIAGGAALAAQEEAGGVGTDEEREAAPDSLDALLADLISAPRNDALADARGILFRTGRHPAGEYRQRLAEARPASAHASGPAGARR